MYIAILSLLVALSLKLNKKIELIFSTITYSQTGGPCEIWTSANVFTEILKWFWSSWL